MARTSTPSPPLLPLNPPVNDPPPPYPSRERRTRTARAGRRRAQQSSQHTQVSSTESDYDALTSPQPFPVSEDADGPNADVAETTPLLTPLSASRRTRAGRPRTLSYTSTLFSSASAAPSITQTLISLFQTEPESEPDYSSSSNENEARPLLSVEDHDGARRHCPPEFEQRRRPSFFSRRSWKRYFRPMTQRPYYAALFHLMVLNFPYALAAWVYLFVFTLTGTTLLMALPLGAVLCFFNLLGARTFARGELALQTRFHGPLAYPPPYPPRPIFTRLREPTPTPSVLESGSAPPPPALAPASTSQPEYETSFYKNAYAMFTDSTSYQALFYFLVIKPGITLLFSLLLVVLVPAALVLVLPAPAVFRAVRRLGIWQANVAVEGLYMAVS